MKIGIPKEVKNHEYRVGATPAMVHALLTQNPTHEVKVQTGAGAMVGYSDEDYQKVGARIVSNAKAAYDSDMVIKVKEPIESEYQFLKPNQILFCYLHLAPNAPLTQELIKRDVIAISYETVTDDLGGLPLLHPMSEIAGRVAIQVGATALQMNHGGLGVLLGGVPGVPPAHVVIIGGGAAGTESARMAYGLGADVTVLDNNLTKLRQLDAYFEGKIHTAFSTPFSIEQYAQKADLLVGAVLIPGKMAPRLLTRAQVKKMKPNSVIVDVAIDQGGCFETSRPTTHHEPTYEDEGVIHYCVTNMPGACARTATQALTNATMPYVLELANKGYAIALQKDPHLRNGLNIYKGKVTNESVANDQELEYVPSKHLL